MKKIIFMTGTRADFGKLKSLIQVTRDSGKYETHIFATGMHMNSKYGQTVDEIFKAGFDNIYQYINHEIIDNMDRTLARTIDGFSHYIAMLKPDLIVVHGDRVEALAGAITGSLNNILVAHIEGGELSGTIDELIRHAVSKLSHIHLVANQDAKQRLLQLGELQESVFVLGSPDFDLMRPEFLPDVKLAKQYYDIEFSDYAIAIFHPVTTEYNEIHEHARNFVHALIESDLNYIVIYPNNDLGSREILNEYGAIKGNARFKIFPSLRFEYFLTLLRDSNFIVGNSSAGIREAPFYNVPTVDIGTRQHNRAKLSSIFHSGYQSSAVVRTIENVKQYKGLGTSEPFHFGSGKSKQLFLDLLDSGVFWDINCQKQFQERRLHEQN